MGVANPWLRHRPKQACFDPQQLRHIGDVAIRLDPPDRLIDVCHAFGELPNRGEALDQRDVEFGGDQFKTHRVECFQTRPQGLNPAYLITPSDGELRFSALRDRQQGSQGMRFGLGNR